MKPVCLITGAAGRLGQALLTALGDEYHIVAAYHERTPQLPQKVRESSDIEPVLCVQTELSSRQDIRRLAEAALSKFGRVDALVNSAADIRFHGRLCELWESDPYPDRQLHINCVAPMLLASALHQMCWKRSVADNVRWNRSVVNVSSMSGLHAYESKGQGYYSASKAALNMLSQHLALELKPYAVRVNALCPGQFRDDAATAKVVESVIGLLRGTATGSVVSLSTRAPRARVE